MKKELKFEEALSELDGIVKQLESGALTLDQSLDAFKNAVELVKICNERIDNARQQVKILVENPDGSITDKAFIDQDEA